MFDLIIRGGRVVDGAGNPWFPADVAISGDRISEVGRLDGAEAEREIDASGKIVCPGFVDIHSHSDFIMAVDEHMQILAPFPEQGITTIVTGNCGYSPAPVNPATSAELASYTQFLCGPPLPDAWRSFGEYLDYLEANGVGLNVVPMVAHGALRIHEVGFAGRGLTDHEHRAMRRQLEQALDEGAFGLSTGLLYAPGIFAPPEEIEALAASLARYDAIYTSHIRGSSETLLPATKEVIKVGEVNGVRCQHSHVEAFGRQHWRKIDTVLSLHEDARRRGVDTGFDVIPYTAANTTLLAIFPPWALSGGVDALLGRLRDPEQRERIRRSIEEDQPGWPCWVEGTWPHNLVLATGWDNVQVMWVASTENSHLQGKSIAEIAASRDADPFDVAADLVLDEGGHAMALYIGVSGEPGDDAGLETLLRHPAAAVETDAILTGQGVPHPAAHGAFPRVLGEFARDRRSFPMEEAIRKMTSLPAQRFGLRHRGLLRPGMFADIVVFDPDTVADHTTYDHPDAAPEGIERVLINGREVVREGKLDRHALAGRVVRRGSSEE